MERRWLALARHHEFTERLGVFTSENSSRLKKADGLYAEASGGHAPQWREIDSLSDGQRGPLQFDGLSDGERGPPQADLLRRRDGEPIAPHPVEAAQDDGHDRSRWLALIVESSDDAIISKDLNGVITSWNKGAERVFGYRSDEVVGKSITILIPSGRHDEEPTILDRIRHGERIDHYETIRQRKDGSLIVVSLTVSPMRDAHGRIVGASKIARDITEQKRNEALIATLAREAEHRTKNVLATVQAAVHLSQAETPDDLKRAIGGRITALAKVHALFVQSRWAGAELSTLAAQELAPYLHDGAPRARVDGPQLVLLPMVAQSIAMILHELATNAAKYGALSAVGGRVDVTWSLADDGRLVLVWRETGGPPVTPPTHRGFGSRVTEQIIGQLGGTVHSDWRQDGLACEIAFPLPADAES